MTGFQFYRIFGDNFIQKRQVHIFVFNKRTTFFRVGIYKVASKEASLLLYRRRMGFMSVCLRVCGL